MENPILEKNLDCIAKYNPKLKADLLSIKSLTNQIELIETSTGEPNLSYNKLPLHSMSEAEVEAKNIVAKTKNIPTSMHVVFGMGLGYLFKEFAEQSKGKVIVYEPNLEILRVTLEIVDFSKELSQPNVRVASDIETFKQIFIHEYSYKASATFSFLSSYKEIYSAEIKTIFEQIEMVTGICMTELNTLKVAAIYSVTSAIENLALTLREPPLETIKDIYEGKTALIVSAGPSLDKDIEAIKKNRDKVVIFCVGTALKALSKNGIKPDFVNVIEVFDCSSQVEGIDLSDSNLILEPYTCHVFHSMKTKGNFLFPSSASHANVGWAQLTEQNIDIYNAKGTVSLEALSCAKILGFKKIILVGQDLAYVNNRCYSKDSAYPDLGYQINPVTNQLEVQICNFDNYVRSLQPADTEFADDNIRYYAGLKIKNLNDTLYFVKGVNGEMLPTQAGYATFIEHFKEFATDNPHLNLINASLIGADIAGFKNLPIDVALENVSPIKEKPDLSAVKFSYDRSNILKNLDKEIELYRNLLADFEVAKEYIYKYTREFQRHKTVTQQTHKYFTLLMNLYNDIILKYQVTDPFYQAVSFSEYIELQYEITNSETVDAGKIQEVFELLKTYYLNIEQKSLEVLTGLEKQKEFIAR